MLLLGSRLIVLWGSNVNECYQFTAFAVGIAFRVVLNSDINVFVVTISNLCLGHRTELELDLLGQKA